MKFKEFRLISGGGNSLVEAMENMKNRDMEIHPSKEKCMYVIVSDEISESGEGKSDDDEKSIEKYLFDGDEGGTIVFSTDVNSKRLSDNAFKDKLLKIVRTYRNRVAAPRILEKLRIKHNVYAWTIGKYLRGVYTGDDGKTYNENSLSIDIVGASKKVLEAICKDICRLFDQNEVLLKYHPTKQIYFVKE